MTCSLFAFKTVLSVRWVIKKEQWLFILIITNYDYNYSRRSLHPAVNIDKNARKKVLCCRLILLSFVGVCQCLFVIC